MCQQFHEIKIPHSRHTMYVPCGHCPSCMQKKANARAYRFRQHKPYGYVPYFVTLTYDDKSLPYILRSDLKKSFKYKYKFYNERVDTLPDNSNFSVVVYRDCGLMRGRRTSFVVNQTMELGSVEIPQEFALSLNKVAAPRYKSRSTGDLRFHYGRIGVVYPKDKQDFLRRLRTNLSREYGSNVPITFYASPEYGPTTMRPHWHLCIWFPYTFSLVDVQRHIVKAWPFASASRTRKYVEVAGNLGKYLAQYVNCSSDIPKDFIKCFPLRPTHSVYFGFDKDLFKFNSVFNLLSQAHTAKYTEFRFEKSRGFVPYPRLLPTYVVSRYFCRCKAFSRLTRSRLYELYAYPRQLRQKLDNYPPRVLKDGTLSFARNLRDVYGEYVYMTDYEAESFIRGLERRFDYFTPMGYNWLDYTRCVVDSLISYGLSFLHFQYEEQSKAVDDYFFDYDNIADLFAPDVGLKSDLLEVYYSDSSMPPILQPHEFPHNVEMDNYYTEVFNKNIKHRKCSPQEMAFV